MASDPPKKLDDESLAPGELSDSLKAASPVLVKFIEVVIGALCFCLVFVPYDNKLSTSVHRSGFVYTAYLFTVLTNLVHLLSHFRRYPTPKPTLYLLSVISGVLLLVAGCTLVSEWWIFIHSIRFIPPKLFMDLMMSAAFFTFFLFGIVAADLYVTYKYY